MRTAARRALALGLVVVAMTACSSDERPPEGAAAVLVVSGGEASGGAVTVGAAEEPTVSLHSALAPDPSPSPRPGAPSAFDLPETRAVPVVRADVSDEAAWTAIRQELLAASALSGYEPALRFHDWPEWADLEPAALDRRLPRSFPTSYDQPFLVIVDGRAITSPEHAVLLVDLSEEGTTPSFRALPREVADIEANLSIANLDFVDFQSAADADGVFRGFR